MYPVDNEEDDFTGKGRVASDLSVTGVTIGETPSAVPRTEGT
jgi:hypothetical protein